MNELIVFLITSHIFSFLGLLYYRRKCDILEIPGHKIDCADFFALFLGWWMPLVWWFCIMLYRKAIYNVSAEHKAEIEEQEKDKVRFHYFKEFLEVHNLTVKELDEYVDSKKLLRRLLD